MLRYRHGRNVSNIFGVILDIGVEAEVEAAKVKKKITGEEMVTKEEITLETPLSSTGKNGIIKTVLSF